MIVFPWLERRVPEFGKNRFRLFGYWKFLFILFPVIGTAFCARAIEIRSRDPYYSAVVIDADSGAILKEDHAAAQAYPASMVKMMNLFIVLDDVRAGKLHLDQPVKISHEVAQIGGRQVWLKEGEVFPLEELIYAMMIHSANDAATALAICASGSKEAHAARMTAKAQELGLHNTVFHNVHGLPPAPGQEADVSSALDMARLAKALLEQHPKTLRYSSIVSRDFRKENPVKMINSNKLLGHVKGCDGLKTGYFYAGGFSITATARRDGRRVIAVIMGCKDPNVRNAEASEWIETGFTKLSSQKIPEPDLAMGSESESSSISSEKEISPLLPEAPPTESGKREWLMPVLIGLPIIIAVLIALMILSRKPRG
jgi:D-alanyl-D-alanine carboxypeptidase (penicillin-binding protein 5/6)